jgi:hypothetical protein
MAAYSRRLGKFSRRMLSIVGIAALLNTLAAIPSGEMPGIDEIGSPIVITGPSCSIAARFVSCPGGKRLLTETHA